MLIDSNLDTAYSGVTETYNAALGTFEAVR